MHCHQKKVALYALPASVAGNELREFRVEPSHHGVEDVYHAVAEAPTPKAKTSPPGLLDQIPALLWMTDAQNRLTMTFGAGWSMMPQVPRPGTPLDEFFGDAEAVEAHRCALGGLAMNFEFREDCWDYYGLVEPLFDAGGNLVGTISIAVEASQFRQKLEEGWQLEAALAEAKKNQCVRTLARGMAHNFNNLLTVILGYASLGQTITPADSSTRHIFQEIEAAARTGADIISHLMQYTQPCPAGGESIHLSRIIRENLSRWHKLVGANIRLNTDLAEELPPLDANAEQLRKLLETLVLNASEAIGSTEGTIAVRTRAIKLTPQCQAETFIKENLPEGQYIWLQVSDTGCGMNEEAKAQVFEPFYSTKFIGRGLGLASAQGIVRAHGGAISLSSKPGQGTTFHVLLPCKPS